MDDFTSKLLAQAEDVLFRAGGCHVFALTLREEYPRYSLMLIRGDGDYDHVACDPGGGLVLDYFGWFTHEEYIRKEHLGGRYICFEPIEAEQVKQRFTSIPGQGYYAHPDFVGLAAKKSSNWIALHREYFDGTKKLAIPGLSRVTKTSGEEIYN